MNGCKGTHVCPIVGVGVGLCSGVALSVPVTVGVPVGGVPVMVGVAVGVPGGIAVGAGIAGCATGAGLGGCGGCIPPMALFSAGGRLGCLPEPLDLIPPEGAGLGAGFFVAFRMGVFVTLTIRVGVFVRGINAPVVAVMTPRRVPVAVGEGIAVVLAASVSVPVEVAVSVGRLAAVGIG